MRRCSKSSRLCQSSLSVRWQLHGAAEARIVEADTLLLNRSCDAGGWNYGNAVALGQDLRPYVPTTALALIALQDHRQDSVVERSLTYLQRASLSEPSAMALALTGVCLRIYGLPADEVEKRLAGDVDRAERLGNLQSAGDGAVRRLGPATRREGASCLAGVSASPGASS